MEKGALEAGSQRLRLPQNRQRSRGPNPIPMPMGLSMSCEILLGGNYGTHTQAQSEDNATSVAAD